MADIDRIDPPGPSDSSDDVSQMPAVPAAPSNNSASQRPRVWPSMVIVPLALVTILFVGGLLGIAFAVPYIVEGTDPDDIAETLMSDVRFIVVLIFANQMVLMAAVVLGGVLSREHFALRLALARPTAPLWTMLPIFIGSGFVWVLVVLAWPYVFPEASDHIISVSEMIIELGRTHPLLLITLIAILPPIFEELLVRGYVLRRLTVRWGPLVGIVLSTLAFAVLHMDPQHAIGVIPLGLWCGFVAWRTGSVYPAMVCHAGNNACAVMLVLTNPDMMVQAEEEAPVALSSNVAEMLPVSMPVFMLITGACFMVSVVALLRLAKPRWT